MSILTRIKKQLKTVRDSQIRERLLLVQEYYQGSTFREVGEKFGCAFNKVKYWKNRYDQEGLPGLSTKQRSGRPKDIGDKRYESLKQRFLSKGSKQGWQTRQIREYIKKTAGKLYSERQVIRIAQDWGLSRISPRPVYAHTDYKERGIFLKKTAI